MVWLDDCLFCIWCVFATWAIFKCLGRWYQSEHSEAVWNSELPISNIEHCNNCDNGLVLNKPNDEKSSLPHWPIFFSIVVSIVVIWLAVATRILRLVLVTIWHVFVCLLVLVRVYQTLRLACVSRWRYITGSSACDYGKNLKGNEKGRSDIEHETSERNEIREENKKSPKLTSNQATSPYSPLLYGSTTGPLTHRLDVIESDSNVTLEGEHSNNDIRPCSVSIKSKPMDQPTQPVDFAQTTQPANRSRKVPSNISTCNKITNSEMQIDENTCISDKTTTRPDINDHDTFDSSNGQNKPIKHPSLTVDELKQKLLSNPDTHKKCILHIQSSARITARILNSASGEPSDIIIKKREDCAQTFHNDEVVVKLCGNNDHETDTLHGKVIGVLRHRFDPIYKDFVCMPDSSNPGNVMIPLNKRIPKLVCFPGRYENTKNVIPLFIFHSKDNISPHGEETIKEENLCEKLFIVKFLKWDSTSQWPLGVVTKAIHPGSNLERMLNIINIEFNPPEVLPKGTYKHNGGTTLALGMRMDYRNRNVVIVKDDQSSRSEFAFSLEVAVSGQDRIGIHTMDITHFLKTGSDLDKLAENRNATFRPFNKAPIEMLHASYLSAIDLKCDISHYSISVLLDVDKDGAIVDHNIYPSVLQSGYAVSLVDIDQILSTKSGPACIAIDHDLCKLFDIVNGKKFPKFIDKWGLWSGDCPSNARRMVENFKHVANNIAGEYLFRICPELTPSLCEYIVCQSGVEPIYMLPEHCGYYKCGTDMEPKETPSVFYVPLMAHMDEYIGIVVHRLVKWAYHGQSNGNQPPYTPQKISNLCDRATESFHRIRQYHQTTKQAYYTTDMRHSPYIRYPVIQHVDDKEIHLRFTDMLEVLEGRMTITYHSMQPSSQPTPEGNEVVLEWKERIYNTSSTKEPHPNASGSNNSEIKVVLNSRRFNKICMDGDESKNIDACLSVASELVPDVSSEIIRKDSILRTWFIDKLCSFSYNFKCQNNVKVQLYSELEQGNRVPSIQLIELTPTLSKCLEHRLKPVNCFTDGVKYDKRPRQFNNISHYCNWWLELVDVEAADSSIQTSDPITIHNCSITWLKDQYDQNVSGTLKLSRIFCNDRQLPLIKQLKVVASTLENNMLFDYYCVRYDNCIVNENNEYNGTWVGHCMSGKVERKGKTFISVQRGSAQSQLVGAEVSAPSDVLLTQDQSELHIPLELMEHSVEFPAFLLDENHGKLATIEVIPKCTPFRREQEALHTLSVSGHPCAWAIALGKRVPDLNCSNDILPDNIVQNMIIKERNALGGEPNESQRQAIGDSLSNSFRLIQGPPGTGKTVTGVRIAFRFVQINKQSIDKTRQVMYCGPSNKSVDVVCEYMRKFHQDCPDMVRIYSEVIELQDFPLPVDPIGISQKLKDRYTPPSGMEKWALHHMIRDSAVCKAAKRIRRWDKTIRDYRRQEKNFTIDKLKEYQDLVKKAKIEVLKQKELILCTCHSSLSPVIERGTNVRQLIIDEAGMCTEPQSMVPIVGCDRAHQIILLGDHKQLQPIVVNTQASKKGLKKSLFERYAQSNHYLTTLTKQYRMHEAIQEFPSRSFYKGSLKCGTKCQHKKSKLKLWPGGPTKPVAFVHVVGTEETLKLTTSDGHVDSKSNEDERKVALCVANHLVHRDGIEPSSVVILSQYRAQCCKLMEEKDGLSLEKVRASTVVASQGSEYDYVILSTVRSIPNEELLPNPAVGWCRRHMGFITDTHQINVAITRAKKGLFIIGNKHLLNCDKTWRELIRHYESLDAVIDSEVYIEEYLSRSEPRPDD